MRAGRRQVAAGIVGGLIVVLSFTLDAGRILAGGVPSAFAWPVFAAGLVVATWGAVTALRAAGASRPGDRAAGVAEP